MSFSFVFINSFIFAPFRMANSEQVTPRRTTPPRYTPPRNSGAGTPSSVGTPRHMSAKKPLPVFNSYMSLFQVQEKLKKGEVIEVRCNREQKFFFIDDYDFRWLKLYRYLSICLILIKKFFSLITICKYNTEECFKKKISINSLF